MSNVTINNLPTANSIDGAADYLPIYTASATATQGINRNTLLGLSSAPVGLTDSQTLTNKTLTSPTINGATLSGTLSGTYTIGGTPTFPASVMTLTGTQTATNKTLTSPTINSPTITNATISADTLSGYTTSNNGTVYGISVTGGQITNAAIANGTIGNTQIASGGLYASKVYNPYKFSVYRNAAWTTPNNTIGLVTFDAVTFDTGSNYSTSTGKFTVPISGFYLFEVFINFASPVVFAHADIYVNGALAKQGSAPNTSTYGANVNCLLQLSANDYVQVYVATSAAVTGGVSTILTYFSGFLVSAT
jgi:hypothetical protein